MNPVGILCLGLQEPFILQLFFRNKTGQPKASIVSG